MTAPNLPLGLALLLCEMIPHTSITLRDYADPIPEDFEEVNYGKGRWYLHSLSNGSELTIYPL